MAVNNQRVEEQAPFGQLTVIGEDKGSPSDTASDTPFGKLTVVGEDDGFTTRPLPETKGSVVSEEQRMSELDAALAREGTQKAPQASLEIEEGDIETGAKESIETNLEAVREEASSEVLGFLRSDVVDPETGESFGLEGFRTETYNPGGNSGITIGTGVDLKFHTKQSMLGAGVPEEIVSALDPYYGQDGEDLVGQTPLTREQVELVDKKVLQKEEEDIRKKIPTYDNLPSGFKSALVMAVHQYTIKGAPNLFKQVKDGDYKGAIDNLKTWKDKTPELGDAIQKKYRAVGKVLEEKYDWLLQQQQYSEMKNGWYRDPDTGEKFEIRDGERV